MAWTYSGSPAGGDRDALRFVVGDTLESDPLLSDDELDWLLDQYGAAGAPAAAFDHLAARFSRLADASIGPLQASYSQRAVAYAKRRDEARARSPLASGELVPYAGGISEGDAETVTDDEDRVRPVFEVDRRRVVRVLR